MIDVGSQAPDFELPGSPDEPVRLSDFRGQRPVVLVFYAFTFSGICEGEICGLRDDFSRFEAAGAQIVAVSCDTHTAQKAWVKHEGLQFPVLSDFWPHGAVTKAYGVFNEERGCPHRATFVIDRDGIVVDAFRTPDIATPRDLARYEEALAKLTAD